MSKNKKKDKPQSSTVATNRKARHLYHLEDKFEAGIELTGCEVKSLREGRASLQEAYGEVSGGEIFLVGAHISPYDQGSYANVDPIRKRRLLLHKMEINRIASKVQEKGYTVVPLRIYFTRGKAKVEIALGRGKKLYDRRADMKEREAMREIERHMKSRNR
ncbi:MAG: SsrA-binding protein SmpB [Chloroflexi bacterium]|nr:SsrA-binding protein SmpB [Chloroflexota bacterium]